MKIGLLIYGSLDTLSGGYLYDRKLVETLRAQGDSVQIIALPWRNYAAHLSDNLHFHLPPDLDLLIQDELNHPSLLAANRRKRTYPVISLVHHLRASEQRPGWQNWCYQLVEKHYLNSVDGFIFNSQTTRDVVTALVGDFKPAVIAYPPTDRFGSALPAAWVAARAKTAQPLKLIFLGNLIERKGLQTLLQALTTLQPGTFHLDVIGSLQSDPMYATKMQQFVQKNGLTTNIYFHGALDNARLAERLQAAHVLAVPSSYEGFGIVYLEGMGFGLPAIGTSAGAASEIITEGQTGFIIAPNDAVRLAAHLKELSQNRSLLEKLALNALTRYARQPGWETTCANIRAFLTTVKENYG
jgi:glycosyltransferase involved in cell wall biosynthesis